MRWSVPKEFDRRVVIKFAWLPVRVTGSVVVWLEKYRCYQSYERTYDDLGGRYYHWLTYECEAI